MVLYDTQTEFVEVLALHLFLKPINGPSVRMYEISCEETPTAIHHPKLEIATLGTQMKTLQIVHEHLKPEDGVPVHMSFTISSSYPTR